MGRILMISARVAALVGIGFISLFALDVFVPGAPLLDVPVGLVMHLVPSMVLIALLVISWSRPWLGAGLFAVVASAPFWLTSNSLGVSAMLAAPFAATALLFLAAAVAGRIRPPASGSA